MVNDNRYSIISCLHFPLECVNDYCEQCQCEGPCLYGIWTLMSGRHKTVAATYQLTIVTVVTSLQQLNYNTAQFVFVTFGQSQGLFYPSQTKNQII